MLLLIVCILVFCVSNIGNKQFGRIFPGSTPGVTIQNSISITCISLLTLICGGGVRWLDGPIMWVALLYGCVYFATLFLLVTALSLGPVGTTSLICNMGTVISITYGVLFGGEKLTLFNVTGAILMVVVAMLVRPTSKAQTREHSQQMKWFGITLISAIGNGILATIKKIAGTVYVNVPTAHFMFWGYTTAAVICWLFFLYQWMKGERFKPWLAKPKELLLCAAAGGLGSGGGTFLQIIVLRTLPAIVVYPMCTGIMPVILTAISIYVFKEEKLRLRVVLALILCAVGALLMNL